MKTTNSKATETTKTMTRERALELYLADVAEEQIDWAAYFAREDAKRSRFDLGFVR